MLLRPGNLRGAGQRRIAHDFAFPYRSPPTSAFTQADLMTEEDYVQGQGSASQHSSRLLHDTLANACRVADACNERVPRRSDHLAQHSLAITAATLLFLVVGH